VIVSLYIHVFREKRARMGKLEANLVDPKPSVTA